MDTNLRSRIEVHESAIQSVEKSLTAIKAALKELIESRTAHSVEIKHLTKGMDRALDELKKIDDRIGKVEALLEFAEKRENETRNGFGVLEYIQDYWQVGVLIATAISLILTYVFGIKHE